MLEATGYRFLRRRVWEGEAGSCSRRASFSASVDGLNTGYMGPLTPAPALMSQGVFRLHPPSPFCFQGRQEVSKLFSLSFPRSVKSQNRIGRILVHYSLFEILFVQSVAHWTHPNIYWWFTPHEKQ